MSTFPEIIDIRPLEENIQDGETLIVADKIKLWRPSGDHLSVTLKDPLHFTVGSYALTAAVHACRSEPGRMTNTYRQQMLGTQSSTQICAVLLDKVRIAHSLDSQLLSGYVAAQLPPFVHHQRIHTSKNSVNKVLSLEELHPIIMFRCQNSAQKKKDLGARTAADSGGERAFQYRYDE